MELPYIFYYAPYWFFIILGGVLLAGELLGTEGYALWAGIAAITVGVISWLFPSLSWQILWILFAILTVIIAFLWWQWSKKRKQHLQEENRINQGTKPLVGQTSVVIQPIINGRGRIRIADSSWLAISKADIAVNTEVKIIGVDNITLIVEPLHAVK